MNHAAHASNALRNAAHKKRLQQQKRITALPTVTPNYDKFANQFQREHGLKSQVSCSFHDLLSTTCWKHGRSKCTCI
jgi:hypothetical protein